MPKVTAPKRKEPLPPPLNIENEKQAFTCDICKLSFENDLDASRHISSSVHIKTRDNFIGLQNLEKSVEKEMPMNLPMIYESLKLRTVKDLRDLADKGYFDIYDETTADIADELTKVLYKSIAELDSKALQTLTRNQFLAILDKKETERRAGRGRISR